MRPPVAPRDGGQSWPALSLYGVHGKCGVGDESSRRWQRNSPEKSVSPSLRAPRISGAFLVGRLSRTGGPSRAAASKSVLMFMRD